MSNERTSRRDVLVALTTGAGALALQGLGVSGCAAPPDHDEITLATADVADGRRVVKTVGAHTVEVSMVNGAVVARSMVCPHAGCIVRWAEEQNRYLCPCQGGVFDAAGAPVAGPPTVPLPLLASSTAGGVITVRVPRPKA